MVIKKGSGSNKRTTVVFSSQDENAVLKKLGDLIACLDDTTEDFYFIPKYGVLK